MNHSDGGGATLTRLGRAVRTAGGPARPAEPQHREEHRQANWLRDVILGGQDGLVNILGSSSASSPAAAPTRCC